MTRENREELKEKSRPKRIPVYEANRNKITVNNLDNENFMYRWVNDTENRIAMFLEGGWELCDKHGKTVGDGGVDGSRGTSSALSKGMGGGVTAYLMCIPKELWLKDQKRKEDEDIAPLEAAMRKKANEVGDYGKVSIEVKKTS
jgi:hypothetical protein